MRVTASVIAVLLMFCVGLRGSAQTHHLVPLFPSADGTNVDPDAPIRILAPAPILAQSVSIFHPDADARGFTFHEPTVLLYERSVQEIPAKKRGSANVICKIKLTAPAIITVEHGRLRPGTMYHCVVQGVVVNAMGPMPTLEFDFLTRAETPSVRSCTLDSTSQLTCNSRINIVFSENLQAAGIDPYRILTLEVARADNAHQWMPQPMQIQFGNAANRISIVAASGWEPGSSVRLAVDLSKVTGDKNDDREYTTVIRNAGKISIDVVATDGRPVPEFVTDQLAFLEQVAIANTELYLASPTNLGNRWRFVRWTSPLFDLPEQPNVHVTIPCNVLRASLPFTAIVERIDSQQLVVTVDSGGIVKVYDSEMHYLTSVDRTDTITLSSDLLRVVVVAEPKIGFTFKKWISPWLPADGKQSAALVLSPTSGIDLEVNSNEDPYMRSLRPLFEPWNPATETHSLRADIVDVDEDALFDPYQGVVFTTSRVFEELFKTTRQVCIEAEPCWQIIGYSVTNTNVIEFFEPKHRFCVTAELTNPQNRIIFFVQRAPIFLRIEKVLLSTDNPTDVIRGRKTHRESYVIAEKRSAGHIGTNEWQTLYAASCDENGIPFSTYELMCGDEIRLRVRGSSVRGEIWSAFADLDRYVVPVPVSDNGQEHMYQMVIDQDIALFNATDCIGQDMEAPEIRVRACYRQKFGLDAISMKVRVLTGADRGSNTFIERWYDPLVYRDRLDDEPPGGHQLEYIPYHGTRIRVKFTLPLDVLPVFAGGMVAHSFGNMLVNDHTATGLDFYVSSFNDEHIHFEARDGNDINTVVFDACDPRTSPRLQALHGGLVDLTLTTQLTSLTGMPLQSSIMLNFDRLQIPGFALNLNSVKYVFDGDDDFLFIQNYGDMYFAFYGGDMAINKALHTEAAFQRYPVCEEQQGTVPEDCTIAHSDKAGDLAFGQHLLWLQPHWMDTRDFAWFRGAAYDEDCKDEDDCWVNRIGEIIYHVRDRTDGYKPAKKDEGLDWETIVPDLISLGAEFLASLIVPDDQDQFLGEVNFLESGGDLWGMRTSIAPTIQLVHPNVTFTLNGRFYVDKAVVR